MVSRVGKNPVRIPSGVDVKLNASELQMKGKQGELTHRVPVTMKIVHQDNQLHVQTADGAVANDILAGTTRALLQNMVTGVSEGFERKLVLVGVGYRAKVQGNQLDLTLGLSHPAIFDLPVGVKAETPSATEIVLKGVSKQLVNQTAANIRALRPPEPYKGKGIRYSDEVISLKEGKKK